MISPYHICENYNEPSDIEMKMFGKKLWIQEEKGIRNNVLFVNNGIHEIALRMYCILIWLRLLSCKGYVYILVAKSCDR